MIEASNIWMFIAGGCIWFTAGAYKFKEKISDKVHFYNAIAGYVIGMAWIAVTISWILPLFWLLFTILLLSLKTERRIYWVEVTGFYIIILSLSIC
jgi:hypothetical protein